MFPSWVPPFLSYELWKLEIQTPLNLNITHTDGGGKQSEAAWNMWASPFVRLVKLTLEIKGIQYEYVEEDSVNKSLVLLKYNPVHKKVPVLVVNGKPLVESLIILEYILMKLGRIVLDFYLKIHIKKHNFASGVALSMNKLVKNSCLNSCLFVW